MWMKWIYDKRFWLDLFALWFLFAFNLLWCHCINDCHCKLMELGSYHGQKPKTQLKCSALICHISYPQKNSSNGWALQISKQLIRLSVECGVWWQIYRIKSFVIWLNITKYYWRLHTKVFAEQTVSLFNI